MSARDGWSLSVSEARALAGAHLAEPRRRRPKPAVPIQLAAMQRMYGQTEGECCRDCYHLVRLHHGASSYLKCDQYRISHGDSTDWRAKWPACGRFDPDPGRLRRAADETAEAAEFARQAALITAMSAEYHRRTGRFWSTDLLSRRYQAGAEAFRDRYLAEHDQREADGR